MESIVPTNKSRRNASTITVWNKTLYFFNIFAYLLIHIMNTTMKKDSEIKVRISTKEREILKRKAKEQGCTLSSYILQKCLDTPEKNCPSIVSAVEAWQSYNEILHYVKSFQHSQMTAEIEAIIHKYLPQYINEVKNHEKTN